MKLRWTNLSEKEQEIIAEKIMPIFRNQFEEEVNRAVEEHVNDILNINPEDIPIQDAEPDYELDLELSF